MKKLLKILLPFLLLPFLVTGCYTEVATQDDPYANYSSDQNYEDYVYEDEESGSTGYFDEADTVNNYYFNEEEEQPENSGNGTVINNYYFGNGSYYPGVSYDYYPSVSVIFGFGFGVWYPYYYYPWYYPPYYYVVYPYPYWYYYSPYYYSYYSGYYYDPYYYYGGGYYAGDYYKTRNTYVSRIRNSGGRGYNDGRRDRLRNPTVLTNNTRTTTREGGRDLTLNTDTKRKNPVERNDLKIKNERKKITRELGVRNKSNIERKTVTDVTRKTRSLGIRNTDGKNGRGFVKKDFGRKSDTKNYTLKNTTNRTKFNKNTRTNKKKFNTRTGSDYRKQKTTRYNKTDRTKRNYTTKKYNNNTRTKKNNTYTPNKRNTRKKTYTPPKNNNPKRYTAPRNNTPRTYSPPRNNTPRSYSPPRTTTRGGSNHSGGRRTR